MGLNVALRKWAGIAGVAGLAVTACFGIKGVQAAAASEKASATPKAAPAQPVAHPTYSKDIAPILFTNCANCHRPGEVAPFPLLNFEQTRRKAKLIADATESKLMPPWKADQSCGEFLDERRLTDTQIQTIQNWVEGGMPEGNATDLPAAPHFVEGWQLGKPDIIMEMPEAYTVHADGPDIYRCFVIPIPLTEDTYLRAVEYRPGNSKVVHHCIMYLDTTGTARRLDEADPGPGYSRMGGPGFLPSGGLGGWAPGVTPRENPAGTAKLVRKGTDVILQTHFHPDGKVEKEKSTVGLYFAKEKPTNVMAAVTLGNFRINIQPGDNTYKVRDQYTLPVDSTLIGIVPHAHLICKDMKAAAKLPDGKIVGLIHIPDWDFNWQEHYRYANPVHLPKGTVLSMEYTYDNTAANPRNPNNPPQRVRFGEQTTDEMALCWFQLIPDDPADGRVLMQGGKRFLNAFAGGDAGAFGKQPTTRPLLQRLLGN